MFGKRLKLWCADGNGDYASGSWLIAANNEEQAKEILREKTNYLSSWDWDIQPQEGEIIGVEPGVIHSHWYTE